MKTMDALTLALNDLRMGNTLFCQAEASAPWGISSHYKKGASFYIVLSGRCWLEAEGSSPRWLSAGDFVVLPHSPLHTLRDAPGTPTRDLNALMNRFSPGLNKVLRIGDGDVTTRLLGGCFWFEEPHTSPLLRALPSVLYVAADQSDWLRTTVAFVTEEAAGGRLGAQGVITHLSNVLFIQAVRAYLSGLSEPGNWLGALSDPQIGQALTLIHQHWETRWTVEKLAERVAMSRSAFASRFAVYVGETPLRYITRWRMHQAGRLLRTSDMTLAQIATQVGYQSEMAFSRVFKQWMDVAPGRYRHSKHIRPA